MKVILKQDVENVGDAGTIKKVALGFARNHLIPRGYAVEATPQAIAFFEKGKEKLAKAREKAQSEAKALADKLTDVKLTFTLKAGENEKLFGSVGKSDILKSLKASGHIVAKDAVRLAEPIKELGDSEVEIKLGPDTVAKVKVTVVAQS